MDQLLPSLPQSLVLPGPNAAVCHDVGTIDPLFHFLAARHVMFFYFLEGYHVVLLHTKRLLPKSNGSPNQRRFSSRRCSLLTPLFSCVV